MTTDTGISPETPSDTALRSMIDQALSEIVTEVRHDLLRDAVTHAVLGGGKRVRPLITLRCCGLLGVPCETAIQAACSFELIHAFSLVHDDLPALDDDDLRRGRPTVHKAFGESMGILCGDMLQALAFETAARSPHAAGVLMELARATGAMIEGQAWDTDGGFPDELDEAARLDLIHSNKTGALIRGSARAGAIAGGAESDALDSIDRWSAAIGLMFQVVDDILDETQTSERLGKTAGKDIEAGKLTYPSVHGLDGARATVERLQQEAEEALEAFGGPAEPLLKMTLDLAKRTH